MTWTVNSCFVTLAILFLWRVEEIAEACSCSPAHPQQAFCSADVGKLHSLTKMHDYSNYLFDYWMSTVHIFIPFNRETVNVEREGGGGVGGALQTCPHSYVYNYRGREDGNFCLPIFLSIALLSFSLIIYWYSSVLICSHIVLHVLRGKTIVNPS